MLKVSPHISGYVNPNACIETNLVLSPHEFAKELPEAQEEYK